MGKGVVTARVICPYFALDEGEIGLKKGQTVTTPRVEFCEAHILLKRAALASR